MDLDKSVSSAKEFTMKNKAPWKPFFKIYRLWYADLLFEAKFYFVSEHLPDDSDKLVGTVPKGIVMGSAFSSLGIGDWSVKVEALSAESSETNHFPARL